MPVTMCCYFLADQNQPVVEDHLALWEVHSVKKACHTTERTKDEDTGKSNFCQSVSKIHWILLKIWFLIYLCSSKMTLPAYLLSDCTKMMLQINGGPKKLISMTSNHLLVLFKFLKLNAFFYLTQPLCGYCRFTVICIHNWSNCFNQ